MVTIDTVEEADIAGLAQLEACCFPKEEAADEAALRRRAKAFPESFLVMKKDGVIIGMINGCVRSVMRCMRMKACMIPMAPIKRSSVWMCIPLISIRGMQGS